MEINKLHNYSKTVRFLGRIGRDVIFTKNQNVLAKKIRTDIVEMGPVYVKIGQIMSTRADIFPKYLTDEFQYLQNDVKCMDYDTVSNIFHKEFDKDIDYFFEDFSKEPIAAASIGQVHLGRLKDRNTQVAVKVLRQGIKDDFESELSSIIDILDIIGRLNPKNKNVEDFLSLLREIYNSIEYETNFDIELEHMMKFKELLYSNENIIVPRVYKLLSGKEILTMEYLPSMKITDKIVSSRFDTEFLATELMKSFILMILNDGYVHCDPHPGNIGINDEGKIVIYDYGMIKRFDLNIKEYFRKIFFALMNRSTTELVEFMLDSGILMAKESKGKTIESLTGYETILLERMIVYVYNYMNTLDVKILVKSINDDKYIDIEDIPFEFDPQLVYLFKSFSTLEGVCKELYSDFNYIDFVGEVVFDFFDMNMIMDKMVYDIQTTRIIPNNKDNDEKIKGQNNYTKMSLERLDKKFEEQNRNFIFLILLSLLLNFI